jgi:hypothetical protein
MPVRDTVAAPGERPTRAAPAARPPWSAPIWLRLLVLGAAGLGLASPLGWALYRSHLLADRAAAAHVAQEFQLAARLTTPDNLNTWLTTPGRGHAVPLLQRALGNDFRLDEPRVQGEEADVGFTTSVASRVPGAPVGLAGPQRGVLHLRRRGKEWRVRALTFPADEAGRGLLTDFEAMTPQSDPESVRQVRAFKDLDAVDLRRLAASWKADLDVKDRPAGEVLRTLVGELGLMEASQTDPPSMRRRVSLRLQGRSRLEAIDEVSRQAGLFLKYENNMVQWRPGPRPDSVAFAGPFFVEAAAETFPPYPTGLLSLRWFAPRLPAAVVSLSEATTRELPAFQVTGADGQDLYHADNQPYYAVDRTQAWKFLPRGVYEEARLIPLRNLLREVDAVHLVRGQVRLVVPVRVDALEFDTLAPGAARQVREVSLTLREVSPAPAAPAPTRPTPPGEVSGVSPTPVARAVLVFEARGVEGRYLRWIALDRQGTLVGEGSESPAGSGPVRLMIRDVPDLVLFKVIVAKEVLYDFELRDIPLGGRVPRRLVPVQFPGHKAPVTIEVTPFAAGNRQTDPRPARLSLLVHNHSSKDVEKAHMRLTFRDGAGRVLTERAQTWPAPGGVRWGSRNNRNDRLPEKVRAGGESLTMDLQAPPPPDGTVSVTATVTRVGFADGTAWPP